MEVKLMEDCVVTFKATVNGLYLVMREQDEFKSIIDQIEKKLASAGKFFKGASLTVRYRGRKLSKDEENTILDIMIKGTGADIKCFEEDTAPPVMLQNANNEKVVNGVNAKKYYFNGINEGITKFYRGTVRSGQLVSFDGNLVILGDVNPGGEVWATGNVIVMGSLRGNVHAGADGNKEALVVAYNLQPMLLKIANVITRSPDEKEERALFVPELAFVKDNMVYIEQFLPQFK
jgi:septum site-determining protein MinC